MRKISNYSISVLSPRTELRVTITHLYYQGLVRYTAPIAAVSLVPHCSTDSKADCLQDLALSTVSLLQLLAPWGQYEKKMYSETRLWIPILDGSLDRYSHWLLPGHAQSIDLSLLVHDAELSVMPPLGPSQFWKGNCSFTSLGLRWWRGYTVSAFVQMVRQPTAVSNLPLGKSDYSTLHFLDTSAWQQVHSRRILLKSSLDSYLSCALRTLSSISISNLVRDLRSATQQHSWYVN